MTQISTVLRQHLAACAMLGTTFDNLAPLAGPSITDEKTLEDIRNGRTYYQIYETDESIGLYLFSRRKIRCGEVLPFFSVTIPGDAEVVRTDLYGVPGDYVISWGDNRIRLDNKGQQILEITTAEAHSFVYDDSLIRVYR